MSRSEKMNMTASSNTNRPSTVKGFAGFWSSLGLPRKLLAAFSVLALLALVVGVVANTGLNGVKNSYEHALSDGEALRETSLTLSNNLLASRRHEKDFLLRW